MRSRDSTANLPAPETTSLSPGVGAASKALRMAARARCWPSMSAPSAAVVATSTARGAWRETQTPCSILGARAGVSASAMRSVSPVGSRKRIGLSSEPAGVPSSETVASIASRRPAALKRSASTAGLIA